MDEIKATRILNFHRLTIVRIGNWFENSQRIKKKKNHRNVTARDVNVEGAKPRSGIPNIILGESGEFS